MIFLHQCPLSEDLNCCDVLEQIQHSLPAGELLWFRLLLKVGNGFIFQINAFSTVFIKMRQNTRTGGYLVGSKMLRDVGRGILLTHNARQPASRPLQLCCMTWPTQVKISSKQRHTYKLEHRIINKDLYINNDIHILWTWMMNKLSCMNLHDLHRVAWVA